MLTGPHFSEVRVNSSIAKVHSSTAVLGIQLPVAKIPRVTAERAPGRPSMEPCERSVTHSYADLPWPFRRRTPRLVSGVHVAKDPLFAWPQTIYDRTDPRTVRIGHPRTYRRSASSPWHPLRWRDERPCPRLRRRGTETPACLQATVDQGSPSLHVRPPA